MSIESMSLEEKVGQLFIVGIEGQQMSGDIIHLLNTYHVGGIYYTKENAKHPKQLHQLSYRLQSYSNREHPLFIATKQNGAEFNTITKQTTPGLNQSDLGYLHNRVYTKRIANYIGKELHGMGINMNIGPMLHPSNNDTSSYADNVDFVAKHGRATMEGLHAEGILAAADHFPTDYETLNSGEPIYKTSLHPFQYVIEHGAQAIVSKNVPTSVNILQEKLHFDGLVIQDFTDTVAKNNNVIDAINAGAHMILINDTYRAQMNIMNAVIDSVKTGDIDESRLDHTLEHLYKIKKTSIEKEMVPFDRDLFANERSIKFMKQLEKKLAPTTKIH